jgi:predicted transcriptional regulator
MVRQPLTVPPEMSVRQVDVLLQRYPYRGFPVATADHRLLGMVTVSDVHKAWARAHQDEPVMCVATTTNLVCAHPDHTLHWVMQQMGERDISIVPVVTRGEPSRLLGVLTMSDIVQAFAHSKRQQ